MRPRDLLDQAMSPQQRQQATHTIRLTAVHLLILRRIAVEDLADVTVAKAADQVLPCRTASSTRASASLNGFKPR